MIEQYKILFEGGIGEITEKRSRFIATIRAAESEEQALACIDEIKKKYWDANHNCSAYMIGDKNQVQRCSDDGEPSQTAGRPMLDVLLGDGIHNVCAIVTRYFGGTLLGTGGLVRAYSKAVQTGLSHSRIVTKCLAEKLVVSTDYNGIGKIQYLAGQMGITALDCEYTDQVVITLLVPILQVEMLSSQITEATNGRSRILKSGAVYYGLIDQQIHIF